MKTRLLASDPAGIAAAAAIIRAGGLVAFPTETVYGLGADGMNAEAVKGIFAAKERPVDNPTILHLAAAAQLARVIEAPTPCAARLAERFWPGPLTLVLRRAAAVPAVVSAGLETLAVRVPRHPVALELLRAAGTPIAAPSANRSGRPSPTSARHVLDDLEGRIDAVLDGGDCEVGLESTVLDLAAEPARILRPGAVTAPALAEILGYAPRIATAANEASPGTRHEHYQPDCEVRIFTGFPPPPARDEGVLTLTSPAPPARLSVRLRSLEEYSQRLYALFREADRLGCRRLWVERPPHDGLGVALADRLSRAVKR